MDSVHITLTTVVNMRVNLRMTNMMERVVFIIAMAIITLVITKTTKSMELEYIILKIYK
jgi:hypothetical protein